jgi:hypothetical protein
MKVTQIAVDSNGNLMALTDDGNIFIRLNDRWQYIVSPSSNDLPKIDTNLSISDTEQD